MGYHGLGSLFVTSVSKKTVTIYSCDTVLWIFFETDIKIKMLPCKALQDLMRQHEVHEVLIFLINCSNSKKRIMFLQDFLVAICSHSQGNKNQFVSAELHETKQCIMFFFLISKIRTYFFQHYWSRMRFVQIQPFRLNRLSQVRIFSESALDLGPSLYNHTIRKSSKMDGAKYIPNFAFK